ncbi:MAG: hypothetical protein LBL25_01885 [Oscillospiraceae bacterium]|jgi:hypothetical protein|nr:hypothetical protein [Oscillospiraceae bacterium]
MKKFFRKPLSAALALALVLSLGLTALAAWPSFQNASANNGIIATQPPITTPSVATLGLPYGGDKYSAVDAASVIGNSVSYTLYNGGPSSNANGGARVQATNLSTGATVWNVQIDSDANNDNQLSTPYLVTSGTTNSELFAAIQYSSNIFATSTVSGWTESGTADIDGTTATFAPGTTGSISTSVTFADPVSYIYLPTNLSSSDEDTGTYTITLTDGATPPETTTLGSGALSEYGTYDIYNGPTGKFSANTEYTLTITVNNNTTSTTVNQITLTRYDWRLYSLTDLSSRTPTVTLAVGDTVINPLYEGQPNTPINYDSRGYIYWGIYGGTHSYYQYNTSVSPRVLTTCTPTLPTQGFDDFYGAGSYIDGANVYFGSESGLIYIQPVQDFSSVGKYLDLTQTQADAGAVRSSIVNNGTTFYLTSRGTGSTGYLWQINSSLSTLVALPLPGNSTSTPVATANSQVYVGWSESFGGGGIVGVPTGNFVQTALFDVYGNGAGTGSAAGDPVQSSPIVYSDTDDEIDYIYFTTNSSSGKGYAYSYTVGASAVLLWSAGGTSNNPYAVQGFASDGGYLVYGDDGNYLYIMH